MLKLITPILVLLSLNSHASSKKYFADKVHYRTVFGQCPAKAVGRLTLTLMKEFEINKSLLDVKKRIVKDNLEQKYFLSSYNINYNPLTNTLKFQYDCPKALMKVQIYKKDGEEFYTAILVENGKLFDPTYEVLLRGEKKITGKLAHMALPVKLINSNVHQKLTDLFNQVDEEFVKQISEVIVNEKEELTVIMSIRRRPSSAFLGKDYWSEKVTKLSKIISFMKKKKTIPAVINLTNSKKIVVKFTDTI